MTTTKSFIVAGVSLIVLDVATKVVAVNTLSNSSVDLGPLDLRLIHNSGVAFGLGGSIAPVVLIALTGGLVTAIVVAVVRGALPAGVPTGLIVGGALANLGDRMTGGSVVDMLDLGWWPAFNLADVGIVVGVVVLCSRPTPRFSSGSDAALATTPDSGQQ